MLVEKEWSGTSVTRTEFAASETFLRWLENRRRPYEIYYTRERVIAVPLVSTRPVVYGIYRFDGDTNSVIDSIKEHIDESDIYALSDFTFDETQAEENDRSN